MIKAFVWIYIMMLVLATMSSINSIGKRRDPITPWEVFFGMLLAGAVSYLLAKAYL